jgi:hypothetical protein
MELKIDFSSLASARDGCLTLAFISIRFVFPSLSNMGFINFIAAAM